MSSSSVSTKLNRSTSRGQDEEDLKPPSLPSRRNLSNQEVKPDESALDAISEYYLQNAQAVRNELNESQDDRKGDDAVKKDDKIRQTAASVPGRQCIV